MKRARVLVGLLALLTAASAQGAVILSDDFSGGGGALDGATTDVGGATWEAGPAFLDDGTVETVVAASADGNAAFVPLTITPGVNYIASATIHNTFSDWIAFGFLPALPPGGDWTETDFSVRHSNNGAYAWVLNRNSGISDQEGFNGPDTGDPAFSGDIVDPSSPVDVRIELDTTGGTWMVEYFLNDASQGTYALAVGAQSAIAGIGFSRDRNASAGTGGVISNFMVEDVQDRIISGTILEDGTTPFQGASVSADNGGGSDTTDSNGDYAIVVPNDWSGTITPTASGYTMFPASRPYSNVTDDIAGEDYDTCDNGDLGPCQGPAVPASNMWGQLILVAVGIGLATTLLRKRRAAS